MREGDTLAFENLVSKQSPLELSENHKMTKDPLIWGTIKSEAQRYQTFNEHNELVPDLPSQEIAIRLLTTLRLFFLEEGLLTKTILDQENKFIDTELQMSDFTQEGIELIKSKVSSWVSSQSARKNPPDLRTLQKHLKEIRSRNNPT